MSEQLYLGDCLKIMPTLPDQSIDMILTDLPYGTTACSWDSVIPFDRLWEQYRRLIKPRGAIVLFANFPFSGHLWNSNRDWFKYSMVWIKSRKTDFIRAKLKPMGSHEDILVFSAASAANGANQLMKYIPQGLTRIDKVQKNHYNAGGVGFLGRNKENLGANNKLHLPTYTQEFSGYPDTCVYAESEMNPVHPTQKPVDLLAYLIRTYTNPSETVLDNTMGSGSTGVAAIREGRSFIGIEQDEGYFEIARNRIAEAKMQVPLLTVSDFAILPTYATQNTFDLETT